MGLLDTVTAAYAALVLFGAKPAQKGRTFGDYLSKDNAASLRGLFAITVVLHHLSTRAYGGLFFRLFAYVGYLSVAVFFFLSGYGLMSRFSAEGVVYIKKLLRRRIPKILIIYGVLTAIYVLAYLAAGYKVTIRYVLWSVVGGSPIVLNSWYVVTLIFMYLCFCAVFALCRRRKSLGVGVVFAVQLIYTAVLHGLGYEYHWYMSALAFSLGLLWSQYKDRLDKVVEKRWPLWTLATAVAFALTYLLAGLTLETAISGLRLGSRMLSAAVFPALVLLLAMKVKVGNRTLRFLGSISLELYLIHGLVYTFLRGRFVYITSATLWVWLSVLLSVALAWAMHLLFEKALNKLT